jgi:hypothetical protein
MYSGESIDRVFKRCVPEILKPLELLSRDVDFVLACLRVISYGGSYQVHTRCPECERIQELVNLQKREEFLAEVQEKAIDQDVNFEEALQNEEVQKRIAVIMARQSEEQTYVVDLNGILTNKTTEIEDADDQMYNIKLSNDQKVRLTPAKMINAITIQQFQNEDRTLDLTVMEEVISFIIASSVLEVDGVTEWDHIVEWVLALPVTIKKELQDATYDLKKWGTDFDYMVKCQVDDCDHERNISTLLNPITFFMTPSRSEEPSS